MTSHFDLEEILMVVKTYPTPSTEHGETVCTAGIRLRDGAWIRIYPYPFRLVENDVRFKKWQIIEVPLTKATRDPRPESYKLYDVNRIREIRQIDPEDGKWTERMRYLKPTVMPSVQSILDGIPPKGVQEWGCTIRPIQAKTGSGRFRAVPIDPHWTPQEIAKLAKAEELAKGNLFTGPLATRYRPLKKVPYEFRLEFEDLTGAQYDYLILDWEIAQLYFKMLREHGTETVALEKVREKIEDVIFGANKETFLILGNMHFQYKQRFLAVDGFAYPRRPLRQAMPTLFGA